MSASEMAVMERGGAIASAAEIRAQVNLIQEVMQAVMKDGTHFGTIPGTQKPTLYKAGSEKILSTFRIAIEPVVEDLSTADEARFRVQARATSQATGVFLGSGIGEASSSEEKYKWRSAVCDQEWDETPEDRRRNVWKRGSGNRPNYQIKQVRTNHADVANTIMKMAKKRAQIDATLTVTAASDVFAQDIEDLPEELREAASEEAKPAMQAPQRKSAPPAAKPADGAESSTAAPAPAGSTHVKSVTPRQGETNGRKWILYVVQFKDGREGSTLDEAIGTLALDAAEGGWLVEPMLVPGKKAGTFQLTEIVKVVER